MFKLKIKTGGAAFCNGYTLEPEKASQVDEVIRILKDAILKLEQGNNERGILLDLNGNLVGGYTLTNR